MQKSIWNDTKKYKNQREQMDNPLIVENVITGEKLCKSFPVDEEVMFDGGVMITETDPRGIITYANRRFREMTGFTKEELIGSPHSINRHPDMPKGAFRAMWKIIANKKVWRGYVKNLRKDGKYYWVIVYIQAKLDKNGKVTGYVAGRKVAYRESIKEVEKKYEQLQGDEFIDHPFFMSNELYHGKHLATQKTEV